MTSEQLYFAIGVPMLFNTGVSIVLALLLIEEINKRFDYLSDLCRAELRRVQEVLALRLKHLEDTPPR